MKLTHKKLIYINTKIDKIIAKIEEFEGKYIDKISKVHPVWKKSALNLLHYMAFRSFDIDKLQKILLVTGLSNLSHAEAHVMASLLSVKTIVNALLIAPSFKPSDLNDTEMFSYRSNNNQEEKPKQKNIVSIKKSHKLIIQNTSALFGEKPEKRDTRIMVTLSSPSTDNYDLVKTLIENGMNCARINCAKDDDEAIKKIITNLEKGLAECKKECSVVIDIAGPKIRTGNISGGPIILEKGDILIIHNDSTQGGAEEIDSNGNTIFPAHVPCTFEKIFDYVKIGDTFFFDDGKLEGVVEAVNNKEKNIQVKITNAKANGCKLKADKGINFPDTSIPSEGFTKKDKKDIASIIKNSFPISALNLSFVNSTEELEMMFKELDSQGYNKGIILKVETAQCFSNMPEMLLCAMQYYPAGVLLARGDLAVETGWKNFATIQEEIIRICEAAHIPLVWATQVLENLAKTGIPTRAEITDAAASQRAECVMLNKGAFIEKAVKMLDKILCRMEKFQNNKETILPKLEGAENLKLSHKKFDV